MAVAEYERKLDEHRQKMALGYDLLTLVESGTLLQDRKKTAETVAKIEEKIDKGKATVEQRKQAVIEKRKEVEQEIQSEFAVATGRDQEPDLNVVKEEVRRVHAKTAETEKNCQKLTKEIDRLQHDMRYRKVQRGIAPVHFDKSSTDTHVKGYITKTNGELQVFEFNLEEEDPCTVSDFLWDNL